MQFASYGFVFAPATARAVVLPTAFAIVLAAALAFALAKALVFALATALAATALVWRVSSRAMALVRKIF